MAEKPRREIRVATNPQFTEGMTRAIDQVVHSVSHSIDIQEIQMHAPSEYQLPLYSHDLVYTYTFSDGVMPIVVQAIPHKRSESAIILLHTPIAWLSPETHPLQHQIIREFTTTCWREHAVVTIQPDPEKGINNAISLFSKYHPSSINGLNEIHYRVVHMHDMYKHAQQKWLHWSENPTTNIFGFSVPLSFL